MKNTEGITLGAANPQYSDPFTGKKCTFNRSVPLKSSENYEFSGEILICSDFLNIRQELIQELILRDGSRSLRLCLLYLNYVFCLQKCLLVSSEIVIAVKLSALLFKIQCQIRYFSFCFELFSLNYFEIFILQKSILLESCSILRNKYLEYRKFQTKLYFTETRYIKRSSEVI